MYCRQCGTKISDDAAFCPHCGAKVPQAPTAKAEPGRQQSQAANPAAYGQPIPVATVFNSGLFLSICILLTAFVLFIFVDHISFVSFLSTIPGAVTCVGAWQAYVGSRKQPVNLSGYHTMFTGLYLWVAFYLFVLFLYIIFLVIAAVSSQVSVNFPAHAMDLMGTLLIPLILYVVLPLLTVYFLTGFVSQILTAEGAYNENHINNPLAKASFGTQNTCCIAGAVIMGFFSFLRLVDASGVINVNQGVSSEILNTLWQKGGLYHWLLSSIGWVQEYVLSPLADWSALKDLKDLLALAMAILVIVLAARIRKIFKQNGSI